VIRTVSYCCQLLSKASFMGLAGAGDARKRLTSASLCGAGCNEFAKRSRGFPTLFLFKTCILSSTISPYVESLPSLLACRCRA